MNADKINGKIMLVTTKHLNSVLIITFDLSLPFLDFHPRSSAFIGGSNRLEKISNE